MAINTGQGSGSAGWSADKSRAQFTDSSGKFNLKGWQQDAVTNGGWGGSIAGFGAAPAGGAPGGTPPGGSTGGANGGGIAPPVSGGTNEGPGSAPGGALASLNREVNPGTDTVLGQLDKHTNFNSTVMRRIASQANEKSAGRGLTNSSIAIGNATGAMVDQASKNATADAEIYSQRSTENQRADVQLESTRMNNAATLGSARIGADAQIQSSQIQAQSQADTTAANNVGAMDRTLVDTASKESVAKAQIAATAHTDKLDRQARQKVANLSADTQAMIATMNVDREDARQKSDQRNDVYRDMNQGITNIDANAKPASQDEQARRIYDATVLRLEALGLFQEALDILPENNPSAQQTWTGRR